jgi:hypothetical protein
MALSYGNGIVRGAYVARDEVENPAGRIVRVRLAADYGKA